MCVSVSSEWGKGPEISVGARRKQRREVGDSPKGAGASARVRAGGRARHQHPSLPPTHWRKRNEWCTEAILCKGGWRRGIQSTPSYAQICKRPHFPPMCTACSASPHGGGGGERGCRVAVHCVTCECV
ncbi:UNVERIFIED_CONTAM: hypothetical protein K2H54_069437 [Gekko kuhli]